MRLSHCLAALLIASCTQQERAVVDLDAGLPVAGAPLLQSIQRQIFTPSCALSSCHGRPTFAADLDLSSVEHSCAALVGVKSCLFRQRMRVQPGQPLMSYLQAKLVGENLGSQPDGPCAGLTNGHPPVLMPYGGSKLPDNRIELVRQWIAAGAHCDAPPVDAGVDGGSINPPADGGGDIAVAALSTPTDWLLAGARATLTLTLASPAPAAGQLVALAVDDASALGAPPATFVPAGQLSVTFWVQALRPARPTRVRAQSGGATAEVQIAVGGLTLAELLYSPLRGDDGKQWVKLINSSSVPIDLSRYSLGAGSASYLEVTAPLGGLLAPGACFVVGGPESSADNSWPHYGQEHRFVPTIPHPGANGAAGVALFDVATAKAETLPLDTVVYGAANNGGLLRPDGTLASPDAGGVALGHSLVRAVSGWQEAAVPLPNGCAQVKNSVRQFIVRPPGVISVAPR